MKRFKLVLLAIFLLGNIDQGNCQNVGIGLSGLYNVQTESFGAGARVVLFPDNVMSLTPQVSYYFPFNKITEWTVGAALDYKFLYRNKYYAYALVHGGYNRWSNYDESLMKDAEPNNWNLEGGIGITTTHCLRPFAEYRYNLKFQETHFNVGLLLVLGCRGGRGEDCPVYKD